MKSHLLHKTIWGVHFKSLHHGRHSLKSFSHTLLKRFQPIRTLTGVSTYQIKTKRPRELLINDDTDSLTSEHTINQEIESIYFSQENKFTQSSYLHDNSFNNLIHNQKESKNEYTVDTNLFHPKISIIGVGGGGCNSVNNMIKNNLESVDMISCNTDSQSLLRSNSKYIVQLGPHRTKGLGSGSDPAVGYESAQESVEHILPLIKDSNIVFIIAGLGGGTGSGASPVIAQACKNMGILTCALVTLPFSFEGKSRMKVANKSLKMLNDIVDTCIVIPNDNLILNNKETIMKSFEMVDDTIFKSVKGISEMITIPGLINCDFADVRKIMSNNKGLAFMSTGESNEINRAELATKKALNDPILQYRNLNNAKRVLIHVTGESKSLKLKELTQITDIVYSVVDKECLVIVSVTPLEEMEDTLRVTLIITDAEENTNAKMH